MILLCVPPPELSALPQTSFEGQNSPAPLEEMGPFGAGFAPVVVEASKSDWQKLCFVKTRNYSAAAL